MIERPITEPEREFAEPIATASPKDYAARWFVTGFLIAALPAAIAVFCFVKLLVGIWVDLPLPVVVVAPIGFGVLAGLFGGLSSFRTARQNLDNVRQRATLVATDLENGFVHEFSGAIAETRLMKEENPEHPDMLIRFDNGDEVVLTPFDQAQHNLHRPPKKTASIAVLPGSKVVVSVKGR
jgi:hypothetical protein